MKPKVTINEVNIKNLELNLSVPATINNIDAKNLAELYKKMDIDKTFDNESPYVIIKSYINGIDDSDKNFTPNW